MTLAEVVVCTGLALSSLVGVFWLAQHGSDWLDQREQHLNVVEIATKYYMQSHVLCQSVNSPVSLMDAYRALGGSDQPSLPEDAGDWLIELVQDDAYTDRIQVYRRNQKSSALSVPLPNPGGQVTTELIQALEPSFNC